MQKKKTGMSYSTSGRILQYANQHALLAILTHNPFVQRAQMLLWVAGVLTSEIPCSMSQFLCILYAAVPTLEGQLQYVLKGKRKSMRFMPPGNVQQVGDRSQCLSGHTG